MMDLATRRFLHTQEHERTIDLVLLPAFYENYRSGIQPVAAIEFFWWAMMDDARFPVLPPLRDQNGPEALR